MNRPSVIAGVFALSIALAPAAWAQSAQQPTQQPSRSTDIPEDRDPAPSMMRNIDVQDLTAQELRNKPVFSSKSEQVATVKDVTGTPGQARQAILQTGGLLGVGGREVAVPLDKMTVGPDGKLGINMTEDELKLLPKHN